MNEHCTRAPNEPRAASCFQLCKTEEEAISLTTMNVTEAEQAFHSIVFPPPTKYLCVVASSFDLCAHSFFVCFHLVIVVANFSSQSKAITGN